MSEGARDVEVAAMDLLSRCISPLPWLTQLPIPAIPYSCSTCRCRKCCLSTGKRFNIGDLGVVMAVRVRGFYTLFSFVWLERM